MNRQHGLTALGIGMLVLASIPVATGTTTTWSAGTGDWETGGGWSDGKPGDGDHAVIDGGNVIVTNETDQLASLAITGGALTFSNWSTRVNATNVTMTGGTMDVPGPFTDTQMSNRVWLVCSNVFIGNAVTIDAVEGGYAAAPSGGSPGYGDGGADGPYTGGGYGGKGGTHPEANDGEPDGGDTYGSATMPVAPGSGGGGGQSPNGAGGDGGGAVRIDASGTVTINGTVNADGGNSPGTAAYGGGGGSGGSIHITCRTFHGTNGMLSANGGYGQSGNTSGGGGGGRIAVVYSDTATQASLPIPDVVFSAVGGVGRADIGSPVYVGEPGTLHFPNNTFLTETIRHGGQWMVPNFTNWIVNALLVSNGWLRVPTAGFRLTVSNDVTITGDDNVNRGRLDMWPNGVLTIGGDFLLTNGASVAVYSAPTSTASYGALVDVSGDMYVTDRSKLYPYSNVTNGGSPLFRMRDLVIQPNSGFVADGGGYGAAELGHANGYGPGGGTNGGWGGSGAGYGGAGGAMSGGVPTGGGTYASPIAPVLPGSGGCARQAAASWAYAIGHGGGLVRIEASGGVTMDGTVSASGWKGGTQESGGSGGGIFISGNTFSGSGLLEANGGKGSTSSGGGGGGRIAVWYGVSETDRVRILQGNTSGVVTNSTYPGFTGQTNANGGSGSPNAGQQGTVVFLTAVTPPGGTVILIR